MVTVSREGGSLEALALPRRTMVPRCCESGRPVVTDPHTGQTICSCQYSAGLLGYPRVPTLGDSVYGASAAYAAAAAAAQTYVPLGSEASAFYSPLTSPPYDGTKDAVEGWRNLTQPGGIYFPYDTSMAAYPYGAGFGPMDLNAARRKNATKEATNTLKAWLYEHRKNPYPTKGEKIMLAIITKMTLTQVSTWFANARRRLKKENKMTWSPRNRSDDDGDDLDDMGDDDRDEDDDVKLENSDGADSSGNTNRAIAMESRLSTEQEAEDVADTSDCHINVDDLPVSPSPVLGPVRDDAGPPPASPRSPVSQPGPALTPVLHVPAGEDQSSSRSSPCPSLSPPVGHILSKDSHTSDKTSHRDSPEISRPKIWSVSQFLPTNSESHHSREPAVTSSLSLSAPHLYHTSSSTNHRVMAPQGQGHPFLSSISNHAYAGNYGSAISYITHPLPMTMSSASLAFPYTLSSVKSSLANGSTTLARQEALLPHSSSVLRQADLLSQSRARDIASSRQNGTLDKRDNVSSTL